MFLENKYTNWYFNIIYHAKQDLSRDKLVGYFELHHIIPRSLDGNESKENKVLLTAKEHFVCHELLVKMTTGNDRIKMIRALSAMSMKNKRLHTYYNSRLYEKYRQDILEDNRMRTIKLWKNQDFRKKHYESMKYVYTNNKIKEKISNSLKEYYNKNPQEKGRLSSLSKSLWKDPEYRKKTLEGMKNSNIDTKKKSEISKSLWKDPEYVKNHEKRIKDLSENMKGSKNNRAKKCTDGEKIFETATEMAKHYNMKPDTMNAKIRRGHKYFKYI